MLDFHDFGFNAPPPSGEWTRVAYLSYRQLMGETLGNTAHFATIGNWEGENGSYTEEEIMRSLEQRLIYLPGPAPGDYPEGGSVNQDYYAFTWSDALFIVLNVMTYTPTQHLLSTYPGYPDDWTLGEEQLLWLQQTLENATAKWRFLFIHHTVGGNAGDASNSGYGRGGGRAAYVGEQAVVHDLMLEHRVQIFFYGHDHVFTDMVVDGIHYALPGSAGAPWKFSSYDTGYEEGTYWTDSGYGQVTVTPSEVTVTFIAMGGEEVLSFTVDENDPIPLPNNPDLDAAGVRRQ
jgi:3',5'-cyclic AMP phosphodiesterase CpdA